MLNIFARLALPANLEALQALEVKLEAELEAATGTEAADLINQLERVRARIQQIKEEPIK